MRRRLVRSLAGAVAIVARRRGARPARERRVERRHPADRRQPRRRARRIGLAAARQVHQTGGATFVDARPRDGYVAGHIAGGAERALRRAREGARRARAASSPARGRSSSTATGGPCASASDSAPGSRANGWRDVRVLADGYPAWEAAGFPVDAGSGAVSAGRTARPPPRAIRASPGAAPRRRRPCSSTRAYDKLLDPQPFADAIDDYRILPLALVNVDCHRRCPGSSSSPASA